MAFRWAPLAAALLLAGCLQAPDTTPTDPPAAAVGGFSHTAVFPGTYSTKASAKVLQAGPYAIGGGEVTLLKSQLDGVDIEIGVVRPTVPDGVRVPVIADASPYFSPLTPENVKTQVLASLIVPDFVPHGYAYAGISVRGTAGSGGCMDLLGPLERADLAQAVEWLGTQAWSNGNVGLFGISYDGSTPWQAAAAGAPHLKTIVPMEGITDYFQLDYRNGTANSFGLGTEFTGYYAQPFAFAPLDGRSPQHIQEAAGCPAMAQTAQAQLHAAVVGNHDALGFWAARDLRPLVLQNYNGSVFVVQGFHDDNVDPAQVTPFVNQLEAKGVAVKQLWGQWYHALAGSPGGANPNPRYDWHEMLLHWFDYWLKEDRTVDLGPRAEVQDALGQWRVEEGWPPRDAVPARFELSGDGTLRNGTGATAGAMVVLPTVPQGGRGSTLGDLWSDAATTCAKCAVFASEPMPREFRFAGLPTVGATVTPTGPGGYLAAHLFAQLPDGKRAQLGMGGGIDLRYADGSPDPKPVLPGQKLLAKLELEPMDAVVPAGARLVLVLDQGGYGSHLPPPDTFPVQVELGGGQSVLAVKAFERGPDAFFTVPKK
ncbi:MAG: CocE/NonD family hydrolase [Halobacteriales archaeon]|nr:CocE/NonD family hydrolase [Halobacteriales archaeon]